MELALKPVTPVAQLAEEIASRRGARHMLLLCDFDGTLCPFFADPRAVALTDSMARVLGSLASRPDGSLGVISGRRLQDVRDRVTVPGELYIAGFHGLEIHTPGEAFLHPDASAAAATMHDVAAAVKPQFAILIPVALLAGRHWRAIGGAVAGFVAMLLLSLPFGLFLWPDWLAMIGEHPGIVSGYGLDVLGATPMLALKVLGLPLWLDLPFVLFAVWLVWRAFRADDVKRQVLILLAATLIASPYAIRYELAMLAPSLVDALVAGTIRGLLIALPLYCLNVLTIVPALIVSLVASTFVSTDKDR